MIFQRPAGTCAATDCLRNGGARGTWPEQRRSSGLRLVGFVGWALVAAVAASAQEQYVDRNGRTWFSPNQIARQKSEDLIARSGGTLLSGRESLAELDQRVEQEMAEYKRRQRAEEEYARAKHQENRAYMEEAKREAKALEVKRAAEWEAASKEKYTREQARIAATILRAARAGTDVQADPQVNYEVVAGLAEGLITGSFRGQTLAQLDINYSARERYEMALKLYGEAGRYGGRRENRDRNFEAGAYGPDPIQPAALVLSGRGLLVMNAMREKTAFISGENDWVEIFAALGCVLAMPKSELDSEQRRQGILLLADYMGRVKLTGDDGAALASIVIAAAQQTPELRRVPALHEKFVPLVRNSIWAHGFKSWPTPVADAAPLVFRPTETAYWNLAVMLVLARGNQMPVRWFSDLRDNRRKRHLAPATEVDKANLQQALDGWFVRSGFPSGIRRAIQADFDLACGASEVELAGSVKWDETQGASGGMYNLILAVRRGVGLEALRNPEFLQQPGAKVFFATSPFKDGSNDGLVFTFLSEACAEGPGHATRVLTALRWMTEIDDAVSFWEMPRAKWETLVKLGEGFSAARDPQWTDPNVCARLARLRSERLRDEAGAGQWLAGPGRQPGDGESPEKWREWATLGGRPGIRIAAQRHPEHFTEPAFLRRALVSLAGNGRGALSPAECLTAKALLAHAGELTDRETVLAIAKVRGFGLGDWAKLGAWLDEPRRRPNGPDDPLYEVFVTALMERDQAEGYLSENFFEGQGLGPKLQQFERWLEAVLAAKGEPRQKLIDDHFPAVIYGPDVASPYPDLRLLGYDIGRGGWASRALLLLNSAEFDPTETLIQGFVMVEGDNGKLERVGGYDVEPWLAVVAKLPRAVKPEVLLAEISDTLKMLRAVPAKLVETTPALPETKPRELTEEEDGLRREKEFREMIEDRRTRFVGVGCQDALARLASRWSPVRAPAQAALLTLGDHLFLDDEGKTKVNVPGLAARIKWEQAKMRGLDNTAAWAAVRTTLREEDVRTLAKLAEAKGSFVLERDFHFDREVTAAAAVMAR